MKVRLLSAPWIKPDLNDEVNEAVKIIADDVWKDASIRFAAERELKIKKGQNSPKGMQKYINEILCSRFHSHGWEGDAGYYFKNKTWIRITFRHQMSLGSDILDAIKVCKKESMELALILAANRKTLDLISPNDSSAIVSFEKLENEVMNLNGAIDIPLIIGELTPLTSASDDINAELKKERPRDISVPAFLSERRI